MKNKLKFTMGIFIRITALATALLVVATGFSQSVDRSLLKQLPYRFIGPDGNRAIAIVGEPGNPAVTYVGAASGGIFKSTDHGTNWNSIFDDYEVSSVGSLAIAHSDPNIVWAGTGETFLIRPGHAMGDGIYKSIDSGRTWANMGLEKTGRIGRVVVHPRNSDIVFACALGHAFGPQKERGVFRTEDGGKSWEHVLFVNEDTGCSDIAMDPNNPGILFAGMWDLEIKTWGLDSGGPLGGVYVSRDGGHTWKRLTGNGLPAEDELVGKTAVVVAPSNSNRVYALIEQDPPGLYRSNDGGRTWKLVNQEHVICERAPYYTRFAVSPDDENRLYFASVSWSVSVDGGDSLLPDATSGGYDNHDIWIDPEIPDRVLVAFDGGASISLNRGETYRQIVLPIAQMYHVWVDDQIPYYVYGNRQDGFSYRGPSNSRQGGFFAQGIPLGLWREFGGCESGWGIPDPEDHNIVWSGCYDGQLERFDLTTGHARSVQVWPDAAYGWAPKDVKYRWHWSFPIAISPHDHNRVYVGSQVVHQTTNAGQSWSVISPDLTTNDEEHQLDSGGITTDNLMTWDGCVLYAIAESPLEEGLIWTGSNDGQVNITRDGGTNWTNVTGNIKGLPPWGTIAGIEPSRFDAGSAYIAVDLHQVADFAPYVYKTTDYGESWISVSSDVPESVSSYVHVVREDPVRKGMLYIGTDNAVYFSLDDGEHWNHLQTGLPPVPVYWLTIQERFSDLVLGTYGRGFYILDDVTPLRNLDADVLASDAHVFPPRAAYRFQDVTAIAAEPGSHVTGVNPPYGADINVYLQRATDEPIQLDIVDTRGKTIRSLTAPGEAGINRIWWDLRYDGRREVKLRTPPPGKPWVRVGPEGWRPLINWSRSRLAPLAPPGTYTAKITTGGKEMSQTLTVLKDPHTAGTQEDIGSQVTLALKIRDSVNEIVDMINHIEWLRKQLGDIGDMLENKPDESSILDAAKDLEEKAVALERKLFDVSLTGPSEDSFRGAMKLYGKLCALGGNLIGSGADFPPTDQQIEVYREYEQQLAGHKNEYKELMETHVPQLKGLLGTKAVLLGVE